MSSPGQGWVCFVDAKLVEEGCAHSEPAGLFLLNTSVLLITLLKCLKFLVQTHLRGLLQCRVGGEETSEPPAPSHRRELPWISLLWGMGVCFAPSSDPRIVLTPPTEQLEQLALSRRTIKIPEPFRPRDPGPPHSEVSCALSSEACSWLGSVAWPVASRDLHPP